MQAIHYTASLTQSSTLNMICKVLLHANKILHSHVPTFVQPNTCVLVPQI